MKRKMFLIVFVFSFVFTACEYVDFDPPEIDEEVIEAESSLMLKSATGFSSVTGTVYVQRGVGSGLKVESKTSALIESATWEVEGTTYQGAQITHKFTSLGELTLTVTADFDDGTSETRTFTVHSVIDISGVDPVKSFTYLNTDGSWTVLFLIDKERIRHASSETYYYVGDITAWQKEIIPEVDHSYVIDANGNPQLTDDVGKYIGVKFNLTDADSYSFALVHSDNVWADLSGSSYVKSDNSGLILFWFDDGEVIPQGEVVATNLPGETGDKYFRFTQSEDDVTLFFKLENDFTDGAFVVRQLQGGEYSGLITMYSVPGYENWGQIELPVSELIDQVSGFRYGPNKASPSTYSVNMVNSFFYDSFHENIRIAIYKV